MNPTIAFLALLIAAGIAPRAAVSQTAAGSAPATTGAPHMVRGKIVRPNGQPVIGASVELFESEERTLSDSTGRFVLSTTYVGRGMIVARAIGDPPVSVELTFPVDSTLQLVLAKGVPRLASFTVLPPGEFRLSNSTTSEALTPLDIAQMPGAAANVARALQAAPGVNNVDEGTGLFVRGGDVTETRVLVDDVVMISPARFGNPTGHVGATLDPFVLANATLSAGAFGAAYGNALSGIVRMETAGRPSRSTASLTASIGSVSANGALVVTPKFGVRVLANVNDLGPLTAVFGQAQPFDPPPRGGDASATLEYATSRHSRLRLFTMRQDQEFGVGAANTTGDSRYASDSREALTVLSWRDTSRSWQPSLSAGRSRFSRDEQLPGFNLGTSLAADHLVATIRRAPGEHIGVTVGIEHERFTAGYRGTSPSDEGETFFDTNAPTTRTGAHTELVWRARPWAQLTAGVRADRSNFTQRTTLDPRVAFAAQRNKWGFVASVGAYHQIPEPILVRASVVQPMRVVQSTFAIERGELTGTHVRIEGYARRWRSLAQFTPDFDVATGGVGDAIGVDTELRWRFSARSPSRLVWSVLDARRTDARSGVLATAPSSITHSVIWLTEREFGRLSINSALRYATGRPFTDIVGRSIGTSGLLPEFGVPNGDRLPAYLRSDVSVSWLLARRTGPTAVFWASFSNVFNRRNIMRYTWNTDYTVRTPVRSPFNRSIYAGATLLLP